MRPRLQVLSFCLAQVLIISGVGVLRAQMTPGQACDRIAQAFRKQFGRSDFDRRVSLNPGDWPPGTQLLKVERHNLPILAEPSLTQNKMTIFGIARSGELFQNLGCQAIGHLMNPLGPQVNQNGIWCKVRLLGGREGWLFAKPDAEKNWFVSKLNLPRRGSQSRPVQTGALPSEASSPPQASLVGLVIVGFSLGAITVLVILGVKRKPRQRNYASGTGSGSYYSGGSVSRTEDRGVAEGFGSELFNTFGGATTVIVPESSQHQAERHDAAYEAGRAEAREEKQATTSEKVVDAAFHSLDDFYGDLFGRSTESASRDKGYHDEKEGKAK